MLLPVSMRDHRVRSRFNDLEAFLRRPRGSAEAYLTATVLVVAASLARWGLGFIGQPLLPFTTYYPAILFATYIGGLGVGYYAAVLAGLIGWWAFLPPYLAFFVLKPKAGLEILTYIAACGFIIWGANSYRRLVRNSRDVATQLQDEEKLRKVAVDELGHRLKNKIATIQSIVSYQLRGHPELRDAIVDRLIALSRTDDLIMAAQGQGADLRDLLATELGAYEVSRVLMAGPAVFLPAKVALTMALLVHELATNAAKYGALSTDSGVVALHWSVSDRVLELEWRETGGPSVLAPTRRGFGLRLISGAMDQFHGSTETTFESSGVVCKVKAILPGSAVNVAPEPKRNGTGALVVE
jgi:two-component sensor histidine kinase